MNPTKAGGLQLLAALIVLVGIWGWFGWNRSPLAGRTPDPMSRRSLATAATRGEAADDTGGFSTAIVWSAPHLRDDDGWRFDLFTPPEIRYDAHSERFTIRPLFGGPAQASLTATDTPTGLNLVGVRRAAFELQLVGYASGRGEQRGFFADRRSGIIHVLAAGTRVPGLNLAVVELKTALKTISSLDDVTVAREVGIARVLDETSGQFTELRTDETCLGSALIATVAIEAPDQRQDAKIGDVLVTRSARYRVSAIQLAPAAVELRPEDTADMSLKPLTLVLRATPAESLPPPTT